MSGAKPNGMAKRTLTQCAFAKPTQINPLSGFRNEKHEGNFSYSDSPNAGFRLASIDHYELTIQNSLQVNGTNAIAAFVL